MWATTDAMTADNAVAFARRVEELGYPKMVELAGELADGADHVCIQPLTPGSAFHPDEAALADVAAAATDVGLLSP